MTTSPDPLFRAPASATASPAEPFSGDVLARLPKVELHCHLDGSPRLATLLELAQGAPGQASREPQFLARALSPGAQRGSLQAYLEVFGHILPLLQTEAALARVACELAEDAARENVRWIEVRYCPALHVAAGLSLDAVVGAVKVGLSLARDRFGIESGQILTALRHQSPAESLALAALAVRHAGHATGDVVAFDLAGPERGHLAEAHAAAFRCARDGNLWLTCHAGEDAGAASIGSALHACGADRVGHGVSLTEDPALLSFVADHRVGVEACLTSNLQTGALAQVADHPLRRLLAAGVRVALSTDNRLVSHTTLTAELATAQRELGLGRLAIAQLLRNGVAAAFLPLARRATLRAELEVELAAAFGA